MKFYFYFFKKMQIGKWNLGLEKGEIERTKMDICIPKDICRHFIHAQIHASGNGHSELHPITAPITLYE